MNFLVFFVINIVIYNSIIFNIYCYYIGKKFYYNYGLYFLLYVGYILEYRNYICDCESG